MEKWTPEQLNNQAGRTKSDAELIENGAKYVQDKNSSEARLEVTATQANIIKHKEENDLHYQSDNEEKKEIAKDVAREALHTIIEKFETQLEELLKKSQLSKKWADTIKDEFEFTVPRETYVQIDSLGKEIEIITFPGAAPMLKDNTSEKESYLEWVDLTETSKKEIINFIVGKLLEKASGLIEHYSKF